MAEVLTISRQKPASQASDFQFLIERALRYVQLVAGNNWTDYNTHDPGRTILEQLSFAINDLSYRTSQPIADLLAEDNGTSGIQTHFFTPRDILTNNPVTVEDLRKILIDQEGIKNAWLEPRIEDDFYSDGPALFFNTHSRKIEYLEDPSLVDKEDMIRMTGLYDILLEFEAHETYGDLNGNSIKQNLEITSSTDPLNSFKAVFATEFPYWDDAFFPDLDLDKMDPVYERALVKALTKKVLDMDVTIYRKLEKYKVQISYQGEWVVVITDRSNRQRKTELEDRLKTKLNTVLELSARNYLAKVRYIKELVKKASERLYQYRSLCEDFINIKSVKVKEIAICLKVDLEHHAKPNTVLANIYYALEQFLSPELVWSSLEILQEKGMAIDEIFEGPALDHGFLTADQMEVSDRRRIVYVSDLINVISDIKGVKFLGEIELGLKQDGEFKDPGGEVQWHLELASEAESDYFIPRLNIDHSSVKFRKERIPLSTNRDEVNAELDALRANTPQLEQPITLDLSVPVGEAQDVAEYVSIQSHFPNTYQIGELGPSPNIDDQRKAQIKQLKAYLLVFEQLLTNYLAQLANVNQLFSLDTTIDKTYFSQGLYNVPDVLELLKDFLNGDESLDTDQLKERWKGFLPTESQDVFTDRRNRVLDHLMSRFHEQIDDYANIMHSIDLETSGQQLILDKASLLQDYPNISANRGKGFDLYADSTDKHWISGLEQRMARLLGIDLYNFSGAGATFEHYEDAEGKFRFRLKDPTGEIILNSAEGYEPEINVRDLKELVFEAALDPKRYEYKRDRRGRYYLNLLSKDGKVIARSQEYHDRESEQLDEVLHLIDNLRKMDEKLHVLEHLLLRPKVKGLDKLLPVKEATNSTERPCNGCNHSTYSFNISVVLPSWPKRFRNIDFRNYVEERIRMETPAHVFARICWVNHQHMGDFEQKLGAWKKALAQIHFNDDHFLAQIPEDQPFEDYALGLLSSSYEMLKDEEPVRMTLTRTHLKRQVRKLKRKAEQKRLTLDFRYELLDLIDQMEKAELLLNRSICQNALIDTLASLRTIYPEATLYDCEEGEGENPFALNQTILGTFKPLEEDE